MVGGPNATSTGSRALRPNIRKNGPYPVVGLMLVLYAIQRGCKWSSQLKGWSFAAVLSIARRVRL